MFAPSQIERTETKCDSAHVRKFTNYLFEVANFWTSSILTKLFIAQNITPPANRFDKFDVITAVDLAPQSAHM